MPDPIHLTPSAVQSSEKELHTAEVAEDATSLGQEVKCVIPSFGTRWSTNPMPWVPVTKTAGEFYPKRGDRALVATPVDGPEVLVWWMPAEGSIPDVSL